MRTAVLPVPARPRVRASKRVLALRADTQLVARVRSGDVNAFEVLYERHLPGILSFCRHMLGSREEAEDAVQVVFASAHRHLEADDRVVDLRPWLYAIARNRCLSMLRARRESHVGEVEVSTAGLHDDVERRAELRELLADVRELPEDQRAALVLTELQALTHEQVAEVLDCDKAKVKRLVFGARSGLIERREARDAACDEIRVELANARGGAFRRGRLRHHLDACPSCTAFLADLRRQRKMMALILPVIPSAGLKGSVLGALGLGGGAGAAGAGAAAGAGVGGAAGLGAVGAAVAGAPLAATLAKLAVAGALVAGAGVAGKAALDDEPPGRQGGTPASERSGREAPVAPSSAVAAPGRRAPEATGSGGARAGSGDAAPRGNSPRNTPRRSRGANSRGPQSAQGQGNQGRGNGRGRPAGKPQPGSRSRGTPKEKPVRPPRARARPAPPSRGRSRAQGPRSVPPGQSKGPKEKTPPAVPAPRALPEPPVGGPKLK